MTSKTISRAGFHARKDALAHVGALVAKQDTGFTYTFENFFHPVVEKLIEKLNRESLRGMLDPAYHQALTDEFGAFFAKLYESPPDTRKLAAIVPPETVIDLEYNQPYANYNWELLFHIPLAVAVHLSKNQRFAEAQRWFHYVFDPTSNDTTVKTPERYWKFLAFRNGTDPTRIDELLALLSKPNPDAPEARLRESLLNGYQAIREKPFQPHVVARTRLVTYQYWTVMKYLDNLIDWGDSLFRQDTVEALNEATQRYVLAANLLGERPERIPPRGTTRPKTFAELKKAKINPLGDALVALEGQLPFNLALPLPQDDAANRDGVEAAAPLFGIGRTLYFCVPHNEKLLGYWDTVADRLFKIRHCLNIEGVFRQLPLFDPPLDPGMLVKAAAAGIDVRSMVSGLNQPVGPLRCAFLIQKALELAGEVRGMGNALLSVLEKHDGERMALLRQGHEIKIQQLAQEVRFLQLQQARETTKGLLLSRNTALERFDYYRGLLGMEVDQNAPKAVTLEELDKFEWTKLTEENFDEAFDTLVGTFSKPLTVQEFPKLRLVDDSSPGPASGFSGNGKVHLTVNEDAELNHHLPLARDFTLTSSVFHSLAATLTPIPDAKGHGHFWGLGFSINFKTGTVLSTVARLLGDIAGSTASWHQEQAGMVSRYASYERRVYEWLLQYNLTARELMQVGRQIIGSLIAEQVAYHEYSSLQKQVEQSQEVDRFLHEKFTNAELFAWMQGELTRLYYEYYRFAFDTARKAEAAMKFELMRPEVESTNFVKFNYWDGGRKGLLSGDALYLDVKRMEMAYHENNRREYELTKHISLRQLNPLALLALKASGVCEVTLPEWLFDLDGPGHYLRRIKHVALSIPCVTGPYTSVNCTLTLLKSSLRKSPALDVDYPRQPSDDSRFIDNFGAIQSIVTSNGREDGGLFETNLRDERFLPFEGAGAESTWRLELPSEFRQFDYDTIADVILHLRYTARQGGEGLRNAAVANLHTIMEKANTAGLALLFSLKHDFPNAWSAFVHGDKDFTATIRHDDFPYFTQGKKITITALEIYTGADVSKHHAVGDPNHATADLESKQVFTLVAGEATAEPKVLTRTADKEVFLIVSYALSLA